MSEWCQNKRCPEKKNQNQIRGSKGAKYYQSNKASEYYYDRFCSQSCFHSWFHINQDEIFRTIGTIDKQVLPLDDAWYVDYKFGSHRWDSERQENIEVTPAGYYLINKLKGIRRAIPRQQAQTPEDIAEDKTWTTIDDTQAKELAIQLGLAS